VSPNMPVPSRGWLGSFLCLLTPAQGSMKFQNPRSNPQADKLNFFCHRPQRHEPIESDRASAARPLLRRAVLILPHLPPHSRTFGENVRCGN